MRCDGSEETGAGGRHGWICDHFRVAYMSHKNKIFGMQVAVEKDQITSYFIRMLCVFIHICWRGYEQISLLFILSDAMDYLH